MNKPANMSELLENCPSNWGRWGANDEVGALNFLTNEMVLKGVRCVRQGKVFTLGLPIAHPNGDPIGTEGASRSKSCRTNTIDKGSYMNGHAHPYPGGTEVADDVIFMYPQGTTQFDALGHFWYDDKLYNGYDASTTIGGLQKCSVQPIGHRGVVGRGILIDLARHQNVKHLRRGQPVRIADIEAAAKAQGVTIEPRDILMLRTGWLDRFYDEGPAAFFEGGTQDEPGLKYSQELAEWFHKMEIPAIAMDTVGIEMTSDADFNMAGPVHSALLRNLGILFNELVWLKDLAASCAEDKQYTFLYTAGGLPIVHGAGAPVNPVVIK
jgi:kynurenine formamidase